MPGLSIRARGRRLNAAPVQEKNARARKKPSGASVKVFAVRPQDVLAFFSKGCDLALALIGRQPEKKLGKQRSAFPDRRSASAVNSRLGGPGPQWGPFRTDRAGRRDWRLNAAPVRTTGARARRGPSEARLKFFGEAFFQKSFDLALDLMGAQPKRN